MVEIIKMNVGMADPKGVMIPKGVIENLSIEIFDEFAAFHFKDHKTTERFANLAMKLEHEKGKRDTLYSERLKKSVTKYEGKKKEEIREILLKQFKNMGVTNVREV
jgi:hypothetical protein